MIRTKLLNIHNFAQVIGPIGRINKGQINLIKYEFEPRQ